MNLESFIQEKLVRIERQNDRLDKILTTNSVMLKKRLRDMTKQDMFGVFNTKGVWKDVEARQFHSLNIVKSAVKTTTGAITSASPKVVVEPRFVKDVQAEMAAAVSQQIINLKTEEQWTPQLVELIATEPQVAPGMFLWVDWDSRVKKKYSVEQWQDESFPSGGTAVCPSCGYETEGILDAEVVPCEKCGAEAQVIDQPQMESMPVMSGLEFFRGGDTITKMIPSSEIVIDDRGTQGGNVKGARWMLHRHLEPHVEIEAEYKNCPKGSGDFSYPLKWQHTLQMGKEVPDQSETFDDLSEVKDLYLSPQVYQHHEFDEFILEDEEGVRFAIKGKDVFFQGRKLEELPVLCFRTVANHLIDVFPCDFRERLIYISLLANPSQFHGMFLTEMLPMQDVVNYMYTLQVQHTKRNARTTTVLNSGSYDPEDIEKDVVLTKDPLPYDVPISHTFGHINSSQLSTAPMELISMIFQAKGDIGGITPAMQGQSSPSEPYAAQRQQKEQSLGQLTPFLRSIAIGKVNWSIRQVKEAQENWGEEDFNYLLKLNDDWTDEHIDAFLKANLDTDVIFDYEQGSESPRNLFEREMALRQFMQDVAALSQLTMQPVSKELAGDILLRIKQFTQVDVDVDNVEAELRLADSRLDKIKALVGEAKLPTGLPIDAIRMLGQQLMTSAPDLMPSPYEDPSTEVEFYKDKITQELAQDEPNFLLVACCEAMIQSFEQVAVQNAVKESQMQMAAQAPMMEQQMAMAQEQQAQDAESQRQERLAQESQAVAQKQAESESKEQDFAMKQAEMELAHKHKMEEMKHAKK